MEFRILGPLSVIADDGRPVPITGHRQRAVLAKLLLHAYRSVSLAQLVDAVWDGDPPATARRQLQNTVSALRQQIRRAGVTRPVITADGSGYRLLPDAGAVDVREFADRLAAVRALAGRGDARALDGAVATLRSALALWSGPPLSGLTGRAFEAAAAGLAEQRLTALEECLELELRRGDHSQLVGELTTLVAEHPLRERMVGLLMRALHGSGRQAEALQTYQRLRSRLADELGLDPGGTLQELHAKILRDRRAIAAPTATPTPTPTATPTPAPAAAPTPTPTATPTPTPAAAPTPTPTATPTHTPTAVVPTPRTESVPEPPGPAAAPNPVPAQLPAAVARFAGRADQLTHLDGLLPNGSEPTTVVISAIAGLAGVGKTTLAVHWAHRVRDRFPDGHLYVNLRGYGPGPALTTAEAVRGFLDAFAVPPQEIPTTLAGQTGLYRSLLAGKRMLVLLDNARDAEQVRPLLPGAAGCLALVTSRDRLASLIAVEGAHPLRLDLLTPGEARTMLADRIGAHRVHAEPEAVDRIIAACGGVPLVLAIVAARAATHPGFSLADLAAELTGSGLDAFAGGEHAMDVRTVFSWSYHGLDPAAARLFRLLGRHPGPDIGTAAAASLAGVPAREVHRLLRELADAHLLIEHRPGRFTCHDLLRAYAAELAEQQDSTEELRAAMHRVLDHYLRTADRAAHLVDSYRGAIELPEPAAGAAPGDVADTAQALAWFTAEHRVLLAFVAREDIGFDAHIHGLARTLSAYLYRAGYWHEWMSAEEAALRAARRSGNRREQAHAHRGLARVYLRLDREAPALAQLRLALQRYADLGDQVGQAHTQLNLAEVFDRFGQQPAALWHARLALDSYRAAGHPAGQAKALNSIGWSLSQQGQHSEAVGYCREALNLQMELGDRDGAADTLDSLGHAYHQLRDYAQARTCYQRAAELFRETGNRPEEGLTLDHLGDVVAAAGERDAAREIWRRAAELLEQVGPTGQVDAIRAKLNRVDQRLATAWPCSPGQHGPS